MSAGPDLVERLLTLWTVPVPEDDDVALAAFAQLYTDPVQINGATTPLAVLVARGRSLQRAYRDLDRQVLERVEHGDTLAVAFRLTGVHTGPLETPLGTVGATGLPVDLRVIDILSLVDGRIARITVVADELTALHRLGVLALATGSSS